MPGRLSPRPPCRCWRMTRRTRLPRASCARNTGSTRWSCAGSPRAASRWPRGAWRSQAPPPCSSQPTLSWLLRHRDFFRGTDMADAQDDYPAHAQTYQSFGKLVLFTILFIVLLLSCMALGLVGNSGLIALLLGIGGTLALLVAFTVLG